MAYSSHVYFFTATNNSFVAPKGATRMAVFLVGGGGGGGSGYVNGGGGGGGGGVFAATDIPITQGTPIYVTVGAGGKGAGRGEAGSTGAQSRVRIIGATQGSLDFQAYGGAGGGSVYYGNPSPGGAGGGTYASPTNQYQTYGATYSYTGASGGQGGDGYDGGGREATAGGGVPYYYYTFSVFPNVRWGYYGAGGGGGVFAQPYGAAGGGGGYGGGSGAGYSGAQYGTYANSGSGGGGGNWLPPGCCCPEQFYPGQDGATGNVQIVFYFENTPISISDLPALFNYSGGPYSLHDYYAGNGIVPTGSVGYPLGVETQIPSSGPISLSNFYGARSPFNGFGGSIGGLYSGNVNADNDYFGGEIPNGAGWVTRNSNNYYGSVYIPSNLSTAYLTISTWSLYLSMGYAYTYRDDAYGNRSYTYYYDYMRNYGIQIYDGTTGTSQYIRNATQVGSSNSTTFGGYVYIGAGTVSVIPGHTYYMYYISDFYRTSNIGYGDASYGWSNGSTPTFTVTGTSL